MANNGLPLAYTSLLKSRLCEAEEASVKAVDEVCAGEDKRKETECSKLHLKDFLTIKTDFTICAHTDNILSKKDCSCSTLSGAQRE